MRFLFNIILDVIDNYLSSFQKKKKFEFLSFFFFFHNTLINFEASSNLSWSTRLFNNNIYMLRYIS